MPQSHLDTEEIPSTTGMTSTVAVTGGTGKIGPTVVAALQSAGYRVVNISRSGGETEADADLRADMTDAGEAYGAFATADADAIVHLGMLSTPDHDPGHVVFESNAMSTYNVLQAAEALDVDTVVLASSLSAVGASFEPEPIRLSYLPLDESHPVSPSNSYGMGKHVLEVTADGFAHRQNGPRTIASIRFPWMPTDEQMRETFDHADRTPDGVRESGHFETARNTVFAYLSQQDAAELVRLAVEADFEGHERFFASAPDTSADVPTEELVEAVYPDVECKREFEGYEALISTEKAKRMLGWEPERSWR
ncbi:NAD(P)-dependent oxidoreductase [Halogeometricum borinquense]|uniref:NAD(P)-dependent oxidoreductase n=1 Tax=Halogeometricum borinquense TaxID=60847 RepID=A0A6C0UCN7_9EURY|nr:NAD(P)-dependent oxidoreductase [Halogeometricum borinquense]QIB73045.1 NAD(P)-dependent oxidoreductase [Halogeometricum borinquense]QIQ77555.1 NAD(P)-dependent oxidoreductase [Halogeometricum borinquense]